MPRGLSDATTDPKTLRAWWRAYPHANVAIVLGPAAGMWALDIDPTHQGDQSLVELVHKHGPLGATLHSYTGGGGDHFFFRWPGRPVSNSAQRLGPGLDVRGAGGYIVAPPSLHISGHRYTWEHAADDIVNAPPWLLGLLDAPAPTTTPATPRSSSRTSPTGTPGGGNAQTRAVAYLARMPAAISGHGGHATTLAAALALVRGFSLSPAIALDLLAEHYNPRCKPPWSRRELAHKVATAERSERVGYGYLLAAKGAA